MDNWNKFKSFIYISLFFTTSLVKLFVVTVQIFVYQILFTIVFFLEGGKTTLTKPFIFWNESTFLKKAHIGNERSFWNLFWSKKNIKLYNPKLITVGIIRGSRLKSRATEPARRRCQHYTAAVSPSLSHFMIFVSSIFFLC